MKKFFVLVVLFALPIIAYLFFSSGQNNFAKLPVLTEDVQDLNSFESLQGDKVSLDDKISIVAFFGKDLDQIKGHTFNLDQKILEKYYEFRDFQFVIVLPESARDEAIRFSEEFEAIGNPQNWKFVFSSEEKVKEVFESMNSDFQLDENLHSPYVFIVDKDRNLRGRDEDEDYGMMYGYDASSVADLSNKMNDDVKVILAEYRLALKKNNAERKN
ncbi:hypothetical protein [Salegentibacter sp.]|uniref:hypothetical protein n=1 Tax=Salegentibacter sp. TaxID=1903072 RepID=UPI003561C969